MSTCPAKLPCIIVLAIQMGGMQREHTVSQFALNLNYMFSTYFLNLKPRYDSACRVWERDFSLLLDHPSRPMAHVKVE